jgi:hypothetical protein
MTNLVPGTKFVINVKFSAGIFFKQKLGDKNEY